MPMVAIAAVAAFAGYMASTLVTSAILAALIGAVVSSAVAYAGSMLLASTAEKPQQPDLSSMAADRQQAVRSGIEPRRVVYGRALVSGPLAYMASGGADNEYLYFVVCLASHHLDGLEMVRINDQDVPVGWINGDTGMVSAGPLAGMARIRFFDGSQTAADAELATEKDGEWSHSHILRGIAYLSIRLRYDQDVYPQGFSNIAALVRGKRVFDPRTGTIGWSQNPAVCIRDYLSSAEGLECDPDEIDDSFFIAAANICDEAVIVDTGTGETHARYTMDGSFQLDQAPIDVMEGMLTSCAGTVVYVQGTYRLYAGAYLAPTAALTASDFAGDVVVEPKTKRQDLFNAVRGTYIDPGKAYAATEFPPVTVNDFEVEDGQQIFRDVRLPWTNDQRRAQRLGRLTLLQGRDQLTFQARLKYSALRIAVWQTVVVTLPDLGWDAKVFRCIAWTFDLATGFIDATFRSERAVSYAWTAANASEPPPGTIPTIFNPVDLPLLTGLTLTPTTQLNDDGGILPALLVEWNAPGHPLVSAYEIQWRESGTTAWNGGTIAAPSRRYVIAPVIVGQGYEVRVRAASALMRGPWSATGTAFGQADTTAPDAPTDFTVLPVVRGISIAWTLPTASDLAAVEIYEGVNADAGSRAYIGETRASGFLRSLPSGTVRWYWTRARDRSGNVSGWVGPLQAQAGWLSADDIADGIINTAKFAASIRPVAVPETAAELPALQDANQVIFPQEAMTDPGTGQALAKQRLYKWDALGEQWVAVVNLPDFEGQLTGDQLADLAVGPAKLSAGAVTTSKLAVGSGNVIWNSCGTLSVEGWAVGGYGGAPTPLLYVMRNVNPGYALGGWGSIQFHVQPTIGVGQGGYIVWGPDDYGVACVAGRKYQVSALMQAHGCRAFVQAIFYTATGAYAGEFSSGPCTHAPPAGKLETDYQRMAAIGVAPANAAWVQFRILSDGLGVANSSVVFSQAMLSEAPANATEVGPWVAGGLTEVAGGMIRTRSIQADRIAVNAITANELGVNSVVAGKIAAGAVSASQIAAGAIQAGHLAATTIITQAAQIGTATIHSASIQDLSVGTLKVAGGAMSSTVATVSHADLQMPPYLGGGTHHAWGVVAIGIGLEGDGRVMINTSFNNFRRQYPDAPPDTGAGDGGGGGE